MKTLLNLEEWAVFLLCILLFSRMDFAWWWFPALILLPDIGMLGYLAGPKWGAYAYNLCHHRLVAAVLGAFGIISGMAVLQLASVLLFAHISMDRAMGYGLKFEDSFFHTHLGKVGKGA